MDVTFYGKEETMLYLAFAGFFLIYLILGWFTNVVEMSTFSAIFSVAFLCLNLYMFWKEKKKQSST
ncbi:hypothetical protein LC065_07490 [Halobacillus litoralis]|uniref:hypothetical protein n=1 Tax=Halobacillus litoralis TaxID=45668 RepID=UPI001CFE45F4|nr:hypothetical protein [Halobacillus litoralis]WLR48995.1 hypothetical protein LC065_07490 [Halobacillus litoralis]